MTQEVKDYLSRLKRVSTKAFEEHTSPKIIHERTKRGVYEIIEIDGMKFIVEPKNEEEVKWMNQCQSTSMML